MNFISKVLTSAEIARNFRLLPEFPQRRQGLFRCTAHSLLSLARSHDPCGTLLYCLPLASLRGRTVNRWGQARYV
jgi:hypothetical protein